VAGNANDQITHGVLLRRLAIFSFCVFAITFAWGDAKKYAAKGMVLNVDETHKSATVSCQAIPGLMDAMVMPIEVRDAKELDGLAPGTTITFTLIVDKESSYAEGIKAQSYQGLEVDPLTARRLRLLNQAANPASGPRMLNAGEAVPDFALLDQDRHHVRLASFRGKVVVLNFIYTRCALPDFCFRSSNNFGLLQKRFRDQLGKQLVLLTVTFDPSHDDPDALRKYATVWKADAQSWHFLTGSLVDIQRLCALFGVDVFPEEGLMTHSLHTIVIDQKGTMVSNIEGNQFTADQLGDLVQTVLDRR
jgi:protein SCO1